MKRSVIPFVLFAILFVTTFGDTRILYEWVLTSPDRILWCTDDRFPKLVHGTFGDGANIEQTLSFIIIFLPASAMVLFWELIVEFKPDLCATDFDPPNLLFYELWSKSDALVIIGVFFNILLLIGLEKIDSLSNAIVLTFSECFLNLIVSS